MPVRTALNTGAGYSPTPLIRHVV